MNEHVVYVDAYDVPTGETEEKLAAHTSATRLHRAFSTYIFNPQGELLVTQRAATKKVWPGVWTNTCCGHPMIGETREEAAQRRLMYELNLRVTSLSCVVPDYTYKTPPYFGIIEHEYCPIFAGLAEQQPVPNPDEVAAYKWISWSEYVRILSNDPDDYSWFATGKKNTTEKPAGLPQWSWWCKDQLAYLQESQPFRAFLSSLGVRLEQ